METADQKRGDLTLADLAEGQGGTVIRLGLPPSDAGALTRLGLRPGTEVVCRRRLPLGDPVVYRWRGTDVALRRRDAGCVEVICEK